MARTKVAFKTNKRTSTKIPPSEDKIRQRAYYIWEERGRPDNNDLDIWLQAEREIKSKTSRW